MARRRRKTLKSVASRGRVRRDKNGKFVNKSGTNRSKGYNKANLAKGQAKAKARAKAKAKARAKAKAKATTKPKTKATTKPKTKATTKPKVNATTKPKTKANTKPKAKLSATQKAALASVGVAAFSGAAYFGTVKSADYAHKKRWSAVANRERAFQKMPGRTLYHHTTASSAKTIMKSGFAGSNIPGSKANSTYWTTSRHGAAKHARGTSGGKTIRMKYSGGSRTLSRDKWDLGEGAIKGERWLMVSPQNVQKHGRMISGNTIGRASIGRINGAGVWGGSIESRKIGSSAKRVNDSIFGRVSRAHAQLGASRSRARVQRKLKR